MLKDTCLVILSYSRIANICHLVNKFSTVLPILVINNNPSIKLPPLKAKVIENDENRWCIERWRRVIQLRCNYAIVLDDDIEPSFNCIYQLRQEIEKTPDRLVSIYGRSGVCRVSKYEDLDNIWCKEADVDIAVGSCIAVSVLHLKAIWNLYINDWSKDRGDDILVSLSMSDYYKTKPRTIKTTVSLLDEGTHSLNRHPSHNIKRWRVIKNFRSPLTCYKN
jgi:hypothetical protein